jgi:hypothetical protein
MHRGETVWRRSDTRIDPDHLNAKRRQLPPDLGANAPYPNDQRPTFGQIQDSVVL